MGYFTDAIRTTKGNKAASFMRMLTEDMIEESSMVPEDMLEFYMKQAASILYWTATGETIINMPMPSDFKNVIPRELRPNEYKAIEGPNEENTMFSNGQQSIIVDLYFWIHNWLHR